MGRDQGASIATADGPSVQHQDILYHVDEPIKSLGVSHQVPEAKGSCHDVCIVLDILVTGMPTTLAQIGSELLATRRMLTVLINLQGISVKGLSWLVRLCRPGRCRCCPVGRGGLSTTSGRWRRPLDK